MKRKKYIMISGNVSGYYRTQHILKYLADNDYEIIKMPHYCQLVGGGGKYLGGIIKFMQYVVNFPARLIYLMFSDIVFVTAMNMRLPNLVDVIVGRLLRKQVVLDFYFSMYDSEVLDRNRVNRRSLKAKYLKLIDRCIHDASTNVIFLNESERSYYQDLISANANKQYVIIPVCVDERFMKKNQYKISGKKILCWWGTYIPLHGIQVMLDAMRFLSDDYLLYVLGNNEEKSLAYKRYAERIDVIDKVIFKNNLSFSRGNLEEFLVDNCDLALGAFGSSAKAKTVLTNKVVDAFSLRLPVLTGKSKAVEEMLRDQENVFLCNSSPRDLADNIEKVFGCEELRESVASSGYELFLSAFSPSAFYKRIGKLLQCE